MLRYLTFCSSVASMDFHLNLSISLFIATGSFITDCRCFLLVMKSQQISAFPCITSLGLFLLPDHALYFLAFLKLFSLPTPSLPYCYLKACPFFCAICKGSLKNLFFFSYIFHLIVNILVFVKEKSPLLFLSNLCLFCTLLFSCKYLQVKNSVFNLCNFWNTLLIALHISGRWDWTKKSQGPVGVEWLSKLSIVSHTLEIIEIISHQIMPVACTGTVMVFTMAPPITAYFCSLHSGSCLGLCFPYKHLPSRVRVGIQLKTGYFLTIGTSPVSI